MKLGLCRAPNCAGVSFTVAMALPCQSRTGVSLTVAMALSCPIAVWAYHRRQLWFSSAKVVQVYRTVA